MKYEEAVKLWGAKKLRDESIVFKAVTSVSFYGNTNQACPTCGPEVSYEATVWYSIKGEKLTQHKDFEFYGLEEILRDLFEASEP